VIFDTFDTWNVLRGYPQGMPFILRLHKPRDVNDAILDDDTLAQQMRPAPSLKLTKSCFRMTLSSTVSG